MLGVHHRELRVLGTKVCSDNIPRDNIQRESREAPRSLTERNGSISDKDISKQPKIVCNMAKAVEQRGEQAIRTR